MPDATQLCELQDMRVADAADHRQPKCSAGRAAASVVRKHRGACLVSDDYLPTRIGGGLLNGGRNRDGGPGAGPVMGLWQR
jgi:hypothetical protein